MGSFPSDGPATILCVSRQPVRSITCHDVPLDSLRTIITVSPFLTLISPLDWPAKSQMARHIGSCPAGGAAGGGGGGARIAGLSCADPLAACGVGLSRAGRACAGREASLVCPGPPGRRSLPLVIGRPATGLGRGVGLETELGDMPSFAWIVLLLYTTSPGGFCGSFASLMVLTTNDLFGFLLYSILNPVRRVRGYERLTCCQSAAQWCPARRFRGA